MPLKTLYGSAMREREALNGVREKGGRRGGVVRSFWLFCRDLLLRFSPIALLMSVGRSGVTFCRGFRGSCLRHLGRSAGTFCRGFSLMRAVDICRAFCRYLLSSFPLVALWMDVCRGVLPVPFVEIFADRVFDVCRP